MSAVQSAVPSLPLGGGTVTGNLTVDGSITGGTTPGGPLPELVQSTGAAGFALQNATPTPLSWTAPNDGQLHRLELFATQTVTSAETGGGMTLTFTNPGGGTSTLAVFAGGAGVGSTQNQALRLIQAGTTVTLSQTAALTLGAATVWAEFWAS